MIRHVFLSEIVKARELGELELLFLNLVEHHLFVPCEEYIKVYFTLRCLLWTYVGAEGRGSRYIMN